MNDIAAYIAPRRVVIKMTAYSRAYFYDGLQCASAIRSCRRTTKCSMYHARILRAVGITTAAELLHLYASCACRISPISFNIVASIDRALARTGLSAPLLHPAVQPLGYRACADTAVQKNVASVQPVKTRRDRNV